MLICAKEQIFCTVVESISRSGSSQKPSYLILIILSELHKTGFTIGKLSWGTICVFDIGPSFTDDDSVCTLPFV